MTQAKTCKKKLFEKLKIKNIINYYGLVEQTGSIFIECEKCESFISSIFSEVLIRDKNFNIQKPGERGLVQLFSILPTNEKKTKKSSFSCIC